MTVDHGVSEWPIRNRLPHGHIHSSPLSNLLAIANRDTLLSLAHSLTEWYLTITPFSSRDSHCIGVGDIRPAAVACCVFSFGVHHSRLLTWSLPGVWSMWLTLVCSGLSGGGRCVNATRRCLSTVCLFPESFTRLVFWYPLYTEEVRISRLVLRLNSLAHWVIPYLLNPGTGFNVFMLCIPVFRL